MPEDLITAQNVRFSYDSEYVTDENGETKPSDKPLKYVLDGVSLNVRKGEFLAVLGHNGSGKSTIAKHFNAILLPDEGSVSVDGINTANSARLFDIRSKVGMVFQNPDNQIVATIVEEDVAFALENMGVPQEEMRRRVDDALKAVNMYEYKDHSPSQLSGGQKQRVAIAGIIAMCPECILLDEPTAMLDPQGRREVIETVKKLNRENGVTIVLITHYMDEAAKADRIVVMDEGKIILEGVPKDIFSHTEEMKSIGLDVPQVTDLMYELRKSGVSPDIADTPIITEDECVTALTKLLGKA